MSSTSRARLLLLLMVWQALAWLSPAAVAAQAEAVTHAAVHALADAHHHHDDETLRLTDSGEGLPHGHADSGLQPPCLPPGSMALVLAGAPHAPTPRAVATVAPPAPDGLFRPPRSAA